jgi:PAS domain S-box-containing protein
MTGDTFDIGIGPARDRLQRLSLRAEALPVEARDLVDEILEAFAISVEELQVAAEELRQHNEELLAAREEVDAQRSRYRDLFELAPNGYLVTDLAGVIEDANLAAVKLLGAPKVELVGKPLVVYVRPGERDRYHVYVERVTGAQSAGAGEVELAIGLQPRRGPAFPAALTVAPVRDAQGELTGLRWLLRDMTASKQAKERERLLGEIQELMVGLEQEQQTLQTIMENTPAQLALLDPGFSFVRVNAAYAEGAGHSREDLIGRNHFEVFPNPENQAIFEGVRDIGEPVTYQARPFEYPDQPERGMTYWDWSLVPVRSEAGEAQGLVLSLAEVTDQVRAHHERAQLLAEAQEQRRRAEEASRESETAHHLLQALIETMPIGVIVAKSQGELAIINAAAQAILGSPVAGHVFQPERDYIPQHPDGTPFLQQDMPLVRALVEGTVVRDVEILIQRSDGSEFTILASAAPVRDAAGKTVSAVTIFQDITEQRNAEERFRFKADILAQVADAVVAVDENQRVTYLNKRAADVYGVDTEQALGCPLDDLYQIEWLDPNAEREAQTSLQTRGFWQGENVHVKNGGRRMRVEASLSVLQDRQGRSTGFLSTTHDVTARREAEAERDRLLEEVQRYADELEQRVARRTAALQASRARLQAIFDDAAIGIALSDLDGHILESNPALQAMLGYSADELCEMVFADFTHPDDITADLEMFQELVAGSRTGYSLDMRYIHKDRHIVWARLMVSLVRSGKEPVYAVGLAEDITEQRQMQDALLKAEKMAIAGQLGASLAHEINNPLQSVIGCLGLAEKNLAEGADVSRYMQVAREELRRAAGIVAQFRDLHRVSEPQEKRATDLNALVEQVLLLCKKKGEECRIRLSWNAADDLAPIPVVSDRMRQVFLNLILNALDATPEGGQLEVSTDQTPASDVAPAGVCVSFADSGSGIAPEVLPHVFDPFYTTKPQGLGLGLYITHKIVEAHGGRIDVRNRLDGGTVFSVWLPA